MYQKQRKYHTYLGVTLLNLSQRRCCFTHCRGVDAFNGGCISTPNTWDRLNRTSNYRIKQDRVCCSFDLLICSILTYELYLGTHYFLDNKRYLCSHKPKYHT